MFDSLQLFLKTRYLRTLVTSIGGGFGFTLAYFRFLGRFNNFRLWGLWLGRNFSVEFSNPRVLR